VNVLTSIKSRHSHSYLLMRHDVLQIGVNDTASILMEEYTTYDLHLNSRCKMRLMYHTVDGTCDGHVPSMSISILLSFMLQPLLF
jgi:hypothetical protein